jgi:ribosomal protein L14
MLQMSTTLDIADNTGAKSAKMIRRLGQLKRTAGVGTKSSSTSATAPPTPLSRRAPWPAP